MRVIYSINARLAGGGIGDTAYQAASGVSRHGALAKLIVSSCKPPVFDRKLLRSMGAIGRLLKRLSAANANLDATANVLFDIWASSHIDSCDIFHGWHGFSLYSLRRAKKLGAKTIIERASPHPSVQAQLYNDEYERCGSTVRVPTVYLQRAKQELAEADYVMIPSLFVQQSFLDQGYDTKKLIMLPFGVDVDRFSPAWGEQTKEGKPFRVLFVGRVSIRKGAHNLLDAWKRLALPNSELIIVGGISNDMRFLLDQTVMPANVRFVGHVVDPVALFRSADIFAFPSIAEGSALVTYEAMASGLPVVTTPNAGSVVDDGIEGYLVPPGESDCLAERISDLHANSERRLKMGVAARQKAEQYTWKRYGDNLVEAYRHILEACEQSAGVGSENVRPD